MSETSTEILWETRGNRATATALGFNLSTTTSLDGVSKEIRIRRMSDNVGKKCELRGIIGDATDIAEQALREWMVRIAAEEETRQRVVDCIAVKYTTIALSAALYKWGQAVQDEREPILEPPSTLTRTR